jgi:hypothetical protein
MKKASVVFAIVSVLIGSAVGCSQRIGDFTLISTKNVDIGGKYKQVEGRFSGEDSRGVFLGIPLGNPNLKTAVDNCIQAGKGDLISNAVLDFSFWTAIVWGEHKYTVTGDVWVKASMSDLHNKEEDLFELQASAEGYELVSLLDPTRVFKVEYFVSR